MDQHGILKYHINSYHPKLLEFCTSRQIFDQALRLADAERQRQLEQLSMACENLAEARQGGRSWEKHGT